MKYLLLLLVLCTGAALPRAYVQQAPGSAAPQPMYGVARILLINSSCQLSLADGVQPAG
ncbi:hypothetical protein [uncultured Hymenobacter sp.]|uniref:hypothetical protein n=1 Tax=uncultured Hymenobacter sp. TaxID=170016 RepID=UPI0035C9E8D1